MSNINLTAALRSNLLTLQRTNEQIGKTQNILATGLKVNSALDDPTAFFAAQSLNNRASDLSALLDGIGQSISSLQAADKGIKGITSLVGQLKSVAQSAKDGVTGTANAVIYSEDIDVGELDNALAAGVFDAAANDTFNFHVGGDAVTGTLTFAANDSVADVVGKINTALGANGTATLVAGATEGTFRIKVETADSQSLKVTGGTNSAASDFGWYYYESDGVTQNAVADTAAANVATAEEVSGGTGAPTDQVTLEADYDSLRTQINQLVADANYRGTNLLSGSGSLITTFNEDGTSSLTIASTDVTTTGLSISAADFSSASTIEAAITEIESALTTLRATSKSFGNNLAVIQTRQDFTKDLINELTNGAGKLTLADKNEEGAKLLALQTAEQLGIQALALASQSNQSVLRLFS